MRISGSPRGQYIPDNFRSLICISAPNANVTSDTSLTLIKEKVASEKKLNETIEATTKNENSLNLKIASLEAQLAESKNE